MKIARILVILLFLSSCDDINDRTDIERVSGPYELVEINDTGLPSDSIQFLNQRGVAIRGFIELLDDSSWEFEMELSTAITDTTFQESGFYIVNRTKPEGPCWDNLCQIEFESDSLSFLGNQAAGILVVLVDSLAMRFTDIRI